MQALILDAIRKTADVQNIPTVSPGPNEILVNVKAISLNPIDPLYVANPLAKSGRTIGSDFAGIISALGPSVPASSGLKVGDRVAGFLQGACSVNDRPGAFAEYLTIDWDLVWRIPEGVAIEKAAGVSLVALTAAQGMWNRLGLDAPFTYNKEQSSNHPSRGQAKENHNSEPVNFFIYGASTSVGMYAAQMVRISAEAGGVKYRLFGAASRSKWDMLKSAPYGYEQLVDYRDHEWPEQIRAFTGGKGVHFAYDCISEGDTVEHVASTLMPMGQIAIVRSRAGGAWKSGKLPVEPIYGAVWEGLGEEVQYQGFTVKKSPAARAFAVAFYEWLSDEVGSALIPNPIREMPGGIHRVVEDGFRLLGAGVMESRSNDATEEWMRPVSAEKLVYKI